MGEHFQYSAALLCGGKGSRIDPITQDRIPKSLLRVGDTELIAFSLRQLPTQYIRTLVFAVDYQSDQIEQWVAGLDLLPDVQFSAQETPGIFPAIKAASNRSSEEEVVVVNTDEIRLGLKFPKIVKYHQSSGRLATIVGSFNNNLSRHGVLTFREKDGLVQGLDLKPRRYEARPEEIGLVYAGLMIMDKRALELGDPSHDKDWMGLINPLIDANQLGVFIDKDIYYFNVGTPEEYIEASNFLQYYSFHFNFSQN